MRKRTILIGLPAFWIAANAAISTALAAGVRDHQRITREAFHDAGWTDDELIEQIVRCNVATDMARLHAPYREPLALLFPRTGKYVDPILQLGATARFNSHGTDGFHFNNLYSFAAIEKQCNDLSAWVETTADSICRSSVGFAVLTADPRVLALYGMTTHAVQDFYSHTNWVELLSPFLAGKSPGAFPVWEEIMDENSAWLRLHPDFPREQVLARMKLSDQFTSKNAREGGLQSGKARGAPEWDGDPPWEHRHAEGAVHEVIEVLSRRASTLWIRRIESLLDKH
ncbi:MAG TPA: hypothetical protein VFR10_12590 [bacterium]|nr:hypothetical protein [bacterium]